MQFSLCPSCFPLLPQDFRNALDTALNSPPAERVAIMKHLLNLRATPMVGDVPIFVHSALKCRWDVVDMLIERRADLGFMHVSPHLPSRGWCEVAPFPHSTVSLNSYLPPSPFCLSLFPAPGVQTKDGWTALHSAAVHPDVQYLKAFLEQGRFPVDAAALGIADLDSPPRVSDLSFTRSLHALTHSFIAQSCLSLIRTILGTAHPPMVLSSFRFITPCCVCVCVCGWMAWTEE